MEIYNNGVYDLLDESQMKLQTKIIREDILHNMFVHNVTEVEVKTPIEAINLFYKGKKRRRMASTYLNAESSRSHSIFTIRLVQAKSSQSKNITVSQLSLVDLAGSERVNRTKNIGVRLREASQINNSLLNLRKCFEILRDNDNHKKNQLVPYRDNKLTHLFKMFFDGGGSIRMVVCVNPSIADYEETLHVLKFAEISQDVQVAKPIQLNFPTHNSDLQPNLKLGKTNSEKSWDSNQSSSELPKIGFDFDCKKIRNLRFALEQRQTNRNLMKNKLKIQEQRLKEVAMDMEIQNVTKIIELSQSKAQVQQGTERIKSLGIKILDLEQEKVKLHDIIQRKDEQLNSQKYLLEEKSNLIKEAVVEKDVQKLEQQRLINEFKLQRENLRNYILTPSDESEHEEIPQPEILTHESRNSKPPFRQRRSRSVGNVNTGDSWLEHRAGIPTELTTVFKPKVKKMKRLTKLTNVKDLTSSVNKYCLMTQESDSDGEIETKLLKADVIPTTTGGAQVVFNDVEILKRESPSRACRKRSCPTTPLRH